MRLLMRALSPLVFWLAYGIFRMRWLKSSRRRHRLAMELFRLAADHGHCRALSVYGHLLHFRGDGIANRIQGAIYLQQAADKGDSKACYQMGRIFEQGFEHHFPPDLAKSLHYYRLAAEQQHPLAVRRLADVYRKGELGQSADPHAAKRWEPSL
uniref:tetratricopeptide repeat protein n=1 Tax=Marinobacterium profundum TaxID=1714300 RepID=UPI00082FE344|nr:tetratricopeptide repeat protein [Marinobacterium profundum]